MGSRTDSHPKFSVQYTILGLHCTMFRSGHATTRRATPTNMLGNIAHLITQLTPPNAAAQAKYHVRLAPPSSQALSNLGSAKNCHAVLGSMMARFAYNIPRHPPTMLSTRPLLKYSFHSCVTKARVRVSVDEGFRGSIWIPSTYSMLAPKLLLRSTSAAPNSACSGFEDLLRRVIDLVLKHDAISPIADELSGLHSIVLRHQEVVLETSSLYG